MNNELERLERRLEMRDRELADAHSHIAALEQKLLKLKQYRLDLKSLKQERRRLRESPEHRVGQVLLAPYRLFKKLLNRTSVGLGWKERRRAGTTQPTEYQNWFERHRATESALASMRQEARSFAAQPLISILMPVFDTPVPWLLQAVESVLAQAYENWELLLVDDGSTDPGLLRVLPNLAQRDRRIVVANRGEHAGISAASNRGLGLARGEWVAFLDHDDVLEPDALFQIVSTLQMYPDADLIYSDEDKLGTDGFEAPLFKPDWSPDFFLSYNYIGHFTAVRRNLVQKAGEFRSLFDSAQDYDLFLRVIALTSRIHHIPRVLYHWRRSESSSAISVRQKPEQLEASRRAIEDYLKGRGEAAHVMVDWRTHAFRVRRELRDPLKISVIISNSHGEEPLKRCVESLVAKTDYPNYEVLIVGPDASSGTPTSLSRFAHRFVQFPGTMNDPAAKNHGVRQSDAAWLLFLEDTIEIVDPDWLTVMAEHVQRPEVGAVGARLLSPLGTIEQAGIVISGNGNAQPAFCGFPEEHPGTNRQLQITRNCSAVSSACMLTRRDVFQQAGGFDESLSGVLADVDFCLKIRRADYVVVYTPFAKLQWHRPHDHDQNASAGAMLEERWANVLGRDPYYNPNLSRERADFSLEANPK